MIVAKIRGKCSKCNDALEWISKIDLSWTYVSGFCDKHFQEAPDIVQEGFIPAGTAYILKESDYL